MTVTSLVGAFSKWEHETTAFRGRRNGIKRVHRWDINIFFFHTTSEGRFKGASAFRFGDWRFGTARNHDPHNKEEVCVFSGKSLRYAREQRNGAFKDVNTNRVCLFVCFSFFCCLSLKHTHWITMGFKPWFANRVGPWGTHKNTRLMHFVNWGSRDFFLFWNFFFWRGGGDVFFNWYPALPCSSSVTRSNSTKRGRTDETISFFFLFVSLMNEATRCWTRLTSDRFENALHFLSAWRKVRDEEKKRRAQFLLVLL